MAHVLVIEGWISESGNLILSILKKMGCTFTFVTRNPSLYKSPDGLGEHSLFKDAENWIEVDTNDIPVLIEAVKHIKFDGVITACDYYFEAVRSVAEAYDLPCPIPKNLQRIRQKHQMRQAVELAKLPNAKFKLAHSWSSVLEGADEIGYPLIVKPVDLGSSAFVRLVQNEQELKEAFNALDAFKMNYRDQLRNPIILLEEYLKGEEVSVECVAFQGTVKVIGVTDKSVTGEPYFIETGHMFPAKMAKEQWFLVTNYVKDVLKAVDFQNGVAHTEVKLTALGPKVIEINPRVPGNYIVELIEQVTGTNLLEVFVGLALGIQPKIEIKDTGISSAASLFIVPPHAGVIKEIEGEEYLKENLNLKRYKLLECKNRCIEKPIDNACYLGHIIAQDKSGCNAREYGEKAIEGLKLIYIE